MITIEVTPPPEIVIQVGPAVIGNAVALANDPAFTARYLSFLDPNQWDAVDNSTYLQAQIDAASAAGGGTLHFPPDLIWLTTTPLVLKPYVNFQGPAYRQLTAGIRSATGDIFTTAASTYGVSIVNLALRSTPGGGHIFNIGAGHTLSQSTVNGCALYQDNDGSSVLKTADMADCVWDNNYVQHTATATVPTFNCVSATNNINCNSWTRSRFYRSGNYSIHIESTGTGYCQDNRIADINFEICLGGEVRLMSCRSTMLDGCTGYDGGVYLNHRVTVGKSGTPTSQGIVLKRVTRRGGSLNAGIRDINFVASGTGSNTIEACNGTIDLGSTNNNVIVSLDGASPGGTLVNPSISIVKNEASLLSARRFAVVGDGGSGYYEFPVTQSADAAAPAAGGARLYSKLVGGKVQLFVRFPTGAAVMIATEP